MQTVTKADSRFGDVMQVPGNALKDMVSKRPVFQWR
jgi:hypothetical protein